jgi:hypothetical protein
MAMETLSQEEWVAIRSGESEIGYAFVTQVSDLPAADSDTAGEADTAVEAAGPLVSHVARLGATPRAIHVHFLR